MKRMLIITFACLVLTIVICMWERSKAGAWTRELNRLRAIETQSTQLAVENQSLRASLDSASVPSVPPFSHDELMQLRSQVAQARDKIVDPEELRTNLAGLSNALSLASQRPLGLADMDGYVAKKQWGHAGFFTPEATVTTFFSAIQTGDFPRLIECLRPEEARKLQEEFNRLSDDRRAGQLVELQRIAPPDGYRIASRDRDANGNVTLGIQAALGGVIMKLRLQQFGTEWKLTDYFQY